MDYADIAGQFVEKRTVRSTFEWSLWTETGAEDDSVRLLASLIMLYRCGSRTDWLAAWLARVEGGPPHVDPTLTAIRTLVASAVGLPAKPKPADQVEALVAEHLWFFLVEVNRQVDGVVLVEGPSLDVTEPGGDGLVIHMSSSGQYLFRLWEIKKHAAQSRMTNTVGRAYSQLSIRATQYLAKYSLIGQRNADANLARFYGRLLELWVQADPAAAAGVAIAASHHSVPASCFQTFSKRFPNFATPSRLRGLVASLSDLPRVAERVKGMLWSGL